MRQGRGRFGATGKALRQTRDSIADIWGERTGFHGEDQWPARVDEALIEEPDRWVQSACVLCSNGCALDIGVKDGRIVGVRGREVDRVNRGRLGPKGLHGWRANNSPDRLTKPLIRSGTGFREASWDEAMDLIVSKSKELIEQYSGSSIGFYTSGQLMLEEYYTLGVIGKAGIGTPHMDGNTRLCTATAAAALKETFGSDGQPGSYSDIDTTDCILHVGHNIAETDTVLWMKVLDRRRGPNPPKLITIDIREAPTAKEADIHLSPKPGTNLPVLNGLLNLIIEGGGVDRAFVEKHTIGFDKLKETVSRYTPERVEELSEVPAEKLRAAGRMLCEAKSLVSTVLQGVYQSMQATAAAVQVNNINLIRGFIGRPGCGILQMNGQPTAQNTRECGADGDLPAFRNWDNPEHIRELAALWNVEVDKIPHWAPPTHAMEIFNYADKGSIRMLWIQATNPAVSLPDLGRVRSILQNPNLFVVVQDMFPTETTELADVILPAAGWGEKTGTFTNVDRTVHIAHKAVEPPGEAKSDLDIFLDYAKRMDFRDKDGQPLIKWHDPESTFEAWKACTRGRPCDYTGLSHAKLTGGSGIPWPCNEQQPDGTKRLYEDHHFPTEHEYCESFGHDLVTGGVVTPTEHKAMHANGRAILKAAEYHAPHEEPDDEYPFWLSTGRLVYHFHTRTKTGRSEELHEAAPDAFVQMSAADVLRNSLRDGDWVRVSSRRGKLEARIKIGDIEPGRAFIPFHYGYWDDPEHMRAANELTLFEWDAVSKQPHYKYAAVSISKIDAPETGQPDTALTIASEVVDRLKHMADAAIKTVKPEHTHVREYLGLLHGSEQALADALKKVAEAHSREPDIRNECHLLAHWSRKELDELRTLIERYGEARKAEAKRLGKALEPQQKATGFGLVRDLHDCWLLANESHVSLVILAQAARGLRDEQMKGLIERMDEQNHRQRTWLMTRMKRAAPQALTVPS
ncbi:molybdopterin oxidoreductase family protein [Microvirga splendida]|uniref:Nitrate reductase n=1 Tax=Microvirga splendida TaxID=2795727 RepID=A0ABS0Y7L0_9HYPH|nr:nitrate reductase [Microvirga splendida]MBJ6128281.1 nitrate reductase [Microvirga splendida]